MVIDGHWHIFAGLSGISSWHTSWPCHTKLSMFWGLHRMGNVESAASALICEWLNRAVKAGQLKGDAAHYRFSPHA